MTAEPSAQTDFAKEFAARAEAEFGPRIHAFYRIHDDEVHIRGKSAWLILFAAMILGVAGFFIALMKNGAPGYELVMPFLLLMLFSGMFLWLANFIVMCGFLSYPVLVLTRGGFYVPAINRNLPIPYDRLSAAYSELIQARGGGITLMRFELKSDIRQWKFLIFSSDSTLVSFPAVLCGLRSQHKILFLVKSYLELLGTEPNAADAVKYVDAKESQWFEDYLLLLYVGPLVLVGFMALMVYHLANR